MAGGLNMNVVAILSSEATGVQLNEQCTSMNGMRVEAHLGRLKDVKPGLDIFEGLDALVVEVDAQDQSDLDLLNQIVNQHFPNTPVVGTAPDATVQDVRALMRLGVVDFIPQPITREDLIAALEVAAHKRRAESTGDSGGKIISLLKGGGGVGASTLAVQSACSLMAMKKGKGEKYSVSVSDFDLQFGTVALYLDLDDRMGVADLVDSPERLDKSLLDAVMSQHESGVHVLAAPRDVMPLDVVAEDFVGSFLKTMRKEFDFSFIDLPQAWTSWSAEILKKSDVILMISEMTVGGIRQTRRQLDTLAAQGLGGAEVKVVMNRFERGWGKTVNLKESEAALGHSIDYCIDGDYKTVSEAINQGVALSEVRLRSKVEKSIRKMTEELVSSLTVGNNQSESQFIAAPGRA